MMKVAMVTANLSRSGAGIKAVVESLSAAVAGCGVDVRVFGIADRAWLEEDHAVWSGAPATALRTRGLPTLGYLPELTDQLQAWSPGVVHSHGLWMHHSRAVMLWARTARAPVIVSPHGMLAREALGFSPMKKRIALALFQRRALCEAGCLHATCMAERDEFRAFGLTRPIATLPNGIDVPAPASPPPRNDQRIVLSLGRIHPKKGLDNLVRAWGYVEADFPGWRLLIVGPSENGHAGELEALVRELGLGHVTIDGPVYGQDRLRVMEGASVFALSTRNENFAMTVAESLACGVPVISTKGAPWSGLVEQGCGWWIDYGVNSMAMALRTAMSVPDERLREMGRRGREWMRKDFAWRSIGAQARDVYAWMSGKAPRPDCVEVEPSDDTCRSSR